MYTEPGRSLNVPLLIEVRSQQPVEKRHTGYCQLQQEAMPHNGRGCSGAFKVSVAAFVVLTSFALLRLLAASGRQEKRGISSSSSDIGHKALCPVSRQDREGIMLLVVPVEHTTRNRCAIRHTIPF